MVGLRRAEGGLKLFFSSSVELPALICIQASTVVSVDTWMQSVGLKEDYRRAEGGLEEG